MQSEFKVAFKVFVKNDDVSEIRYFTLDRGTEYKFDVLKARILSVFPCLSNTQFSISWMDNESDLITISSNEELLIALMSMNTELRKLYITIDKPVKEEVVIDIPIASIGFENFSRKRPSNTTDEHVNVVCDGCEGAVVGYRYKCLICYDYDLCQSCEASGKHPDHLMLRIAKPSVSNYGLIARKIECLANAYKKHEQPEFSHGKKHCKERRSCHKDKHGEKHGDKNGEKHGEKHDEKHHGRHGRHERKHFMKNCGKNSEAWVNTFTSFMNGFTNLAEDVIMRPEQKTSPTSQENVPSTSNQQESNTNSNEQSTNKQPFASEAELFAPEIELLRGFLKGVKQGFYGEGFSGSTNDSNSPKPTTTPASENKDSKNVNEKSTTTDDCKEQVVENMADTTGSTSANPPSFNLFEANPQNQTADQNKIPFSNIAATESTSTQNLLPRDSDTDSNGSDCCFVVRPTEKDDRGDWTLFNMDESVDNEFIKIYNSSKDSSMEKDMNNITNEFKKHMEVGSQNENFPETTINVTTQNQPSDTRFLLVEPSLNTSISVTCTASSNATSTNATSTNVNSNNATSTNTTFTNIGFRNTVTAPQRVNAQPPTAPPPFQPRDPHVAVALQQMMAMGFSNEEGWLTQLLESGNGNINRVLDILSSVKK